MKNQLSFLGYMLCAVIFSSCVKQQESELFHNTGIVLQKSDFIKGSISINNHFITYEVKESKSMLFDVLVRLDKFEFKTSINYNTEDIIFDGGNAVLSTNQKEVLVDLGKNLTAYLFIERSVEDFTLAEYSLLRLLEYWAKSPYQYRYINRYIKGGQSNDFKGSGEGITCIRLGSQQLAQYDDQQGNNYQESITVANDGQDCFGMCGFFRCPGSFDLPRAWTKDCLDHDVCGTRLGGLYNPLDRNCRDEYNQAIDDYLFGLIRGCKVKV